MTERFSSALVSDKLSCILDGWVYLVSSSELSIKLDDGLSM